MAEAEDSISQTDLLRAFEAAVGRADRHREAVARQPQIESGERDLWVVDTVDVEVGQVCARVNERGDDLLLPRTDLPVTLRFSLRRATTPRVISEPQEGAGGSR